MIKSGFDFELQTMTTMMLNSISDIVVKRFNVHKVPEDQIKTRVVYAPKQRVLADLLDKDQNMQLPVVAVYVGGIARDTTRVYNKIMGSYQGSNGITVNNEKQPLPIDITYNVTIATRYQTDMDQILSHILPYINPYFTISWRTPSRPDYEIRSNVFWNGNVSISYPFDVAATQVAKVVADLSFVFKGWMFQAQQDPIGIIHDVHSTYSSQLGVIPVEYLLDSIDLRVSDDRTDYIVISGVPPQPKSIEPYFGSIGELRQYNVWGSSFSILNNVYVSGAPIADRSTLYSPFSALSALSGKYEPFFALKIDSSTWSYNKDNFMTFVMPSASTVGYVDVILEGPAGYGTLTKFTRVNTFNPYVSGTSEYNSYIPYQFPYLSGIEIRP